MNTTPFVEITFKIFNSAINKPPIDLTVIVDGGCAYWDGENWHTLMDSSTFTKFPIICWPVTWWAYLPGGYKF